MANWYYYDAGDNGKNINSIAVQFAYSVVATSILMIIGVIFEKRCSIFGCPMLFIQLILIAASANLWIVVSKCLKSTGYEVVVTSLLVYGYGLFFYEAMGWFVGIKAPVHMFIDVVQIFWKNCRNTRTIAITIRVVF